MNPSEINTRDDLVKYLSYITGVLTEDPEHWENSTLISFMSGLTGSFQDMHGYYNFKGEPFPKELTWRIIGERIATALIYE